MRPLVLVVPIVAAMILASSSWAEDSIVPKKRSSSPLGIAATEDAVRPSGTATGSGAPVATERSAARPAASSPQAASQAAPVSRGEQQRSADTGPADNQVRVEGNTNLSGAGNLVNTTAAGQNSHGCTNVGVLAKGGCGPAADR